ncbi:WHG domain-containing protein [Microbispora sp. RL4-1S]|uniref:WHG domain-containing protein n=1 Tax=Microbispora oryzae TaxID=2806554 RepID=A0A941AIH0_9ACTN|nr:TetR/AcrR family transcriptional regulator [Microbispora oryzae]MBP2703138.1 WHG domain-containing protein [Microbispora oryzae]
MARAGLSRDAVVDLALRIADEEGPEAVTLSAVAGRAGVAPPSLYKHVRNLADLRVLLTDRVYGELSDGIAQAVLGRSRDDAVRAAMHAWRRYVLEHPGRYSAAIQAPNPAVSGAGDRLVEIVLTVLKGYGLEGADAIHATRCIRSAAHGFAVLEAAGGFGLPEDVGVSYDRLIDMILTGLRSG